MLSKEQFKEEIQLLEVGKGNLFIKLNDECGISVITLWNYHVKINEFEWAIVKLPKGVKFMNRGDDNDVIDIYNNLFNIQDKIQNMSIDEIIDLICK